MIGAADHRRILAAAEQWRDAPLALATVIKTWRSAPCPVGTHMLIHQDGRFTGSVSGGCVRGRHFAVRWLTSLPRQRQFCVVTASPTRRRGRRACPAAVILRCWSSPSAQRDFRLSCSIRSLRRRQMDVNCWSAPILGQGAVVWLKRSLKRPSSIFMRPPRRLLIVGAVEIAVNLANLAQTMGVAVTVIDPRSHFLTAERFPSADRDDRWPDDAIAAHKPDSRTAIVTLSHDPKIDDPALIAALASPARYIAALGSRASHKARCERLVAHGIGPDEMTRIEGPAGVAINAINAPEIALSIAAGIIRAFNDGLR